MNGSRQNLTTTRNSRSCVWSPSHLAPDEVRLLASDRVRASTANDYSSRFILTRPLFGQMLARIEQRPRSRAHGCGRYVRHENDARQRVANDAQAERRDDPPGAAATAGRKKSILGIPAYTTN